MLDVNLFQCMVYTFFHLFLRQPVISRSKCNILKYRRHEKLAVGILEDIADFFAHFGKHLFYNRHFLHTDAAFVVQIQSHQKFQQRRFSNTVRADQSDAVIFVCSKRDVLQNRD